MSEVERALARIDTGAIERNVRHLGSLLGADTELCAVVKADGYGHGHAAAARAALAGGAAWLAVATAREAQALRDAGLADARVLVMGALTHEDLRIALAARADVVAWTRELVEAIDVPASFAARVHVKLDSGMGRLGTKDPQEARELCALVDAREGLELAGLMTHFATADEPGDDHFPEQLERFTPLAREVKGAYPQAIVHAANSAAVYRDRAAHFDLVRCGVAVYGLDPFGEDPANRGLDPALRLESYVAAVKRFEPGESVGYGRTWKASGPTCVGVLPIGYGDGWRRALSNNADVLVRGRRRPLVGTVSMDNVTIDLGAETDVRVGDPAVLIGEQDGEHILCEEVARRLDTINYEVTCGLTHRVRREHA
ncbi:MAG: alanine racemase [Gaiellaceae bacterium]